MRQRLQSRISWSTLSFPEALVLGEPGRATRAGGERRERNAVKKDESRHETRAVHQRSCVPHAREALHSELRVRTRNRAPGPLPGLGTNDERASAAQTVRGH